MNFPNPLIYVTDDATIVAAVRTMIEAASAHEQALEQLMVDINCAYPLNGGIIVPVFAERVLVGVVSPTHPLALLDGWERSPLIDAYLPDLSHPEGQKWAARIDALPPVAEPITDEVLRMPLAVHENSSGSHFHASLHFMRDSDQVAMVWPLRALAAPVEYAVTNFYQSTAWRPMLRSEFFAYVEQTELAQEATDLAEEAAAADAAERSYSLPLGDADADDDSDGALTADDLNFLDDDEQR